LETQFRVIASKWYINRFQAPTFCLGRVKSLLFTKVSTNHAQLIAFIYSCSKSPFSNHIHTEFLMAFKAKSSCNPSWKMANRPGKVRFNWQANKL